LTPSLNFGENQNWKKKEGNILNLNKKSNYFKCDTICILIWRHTIPGRWYSYHKLLKHKLWAPPPPPMGFDGIYSGMVVISVWGEPTASIFRVYEDGHMKHWQQHTRLQHGVIPQTNTTWKLWDKYRTTFRDCRFQQ
jgi:hypothetical protein